VQCINWWTLHRSRNSSPTNIISEIAFGKPFSNLEADEDTSCIKATEEIFPMTVLLGVFPWLAQVSFSRPFKSLLSSDIDTVGMGKLMGFVFLHIPLTNTSFNLTCIGLRRNWPGSFGPDKKGQHNMLGSFIRRGLTQKEAQSESLLQL
jgi:hypothetical protein